MITKTLILCVALVLLMPSIAIADTFTYEVNVYRHDIGRVICDGLPLNCSDGDACWDQGDLCYDAPANSIGNPYGDKCELVEELNYTFEVLLTPDFDWDLDNDAVYDYEDDGISTWDSIYNRSLGILDDGAFSRTANDDDYAAYEELVIRDDLVADEQARHWDVLLGGDVGTHEYGQVHNHQVLEDCNPDNSPSPYKDICLEFTESATYGIESSDVTNGIQSANQTINISFYGYYDDDWEIGDKHYFQMFIEAEKGNPETSFFRWNWSVTPSYVEWGQSELSLGNGTVSEGNLTGYESIIAHGSHTNVNVSCVYGNCSTILEYWNDSNDMVEYERQNVNFVCLGDTVGGFSAVYSVDSDEDTIPDFITVSCEITELVCQTDYDRLDNITITPLCEQVGIAESQPLIVPLGLLLVLLGIALVLDAATITRK